MKKLLFLMGGSLVVAAAVAQEPADALRNSWTIQGGTARSQAIGGAMGSLGGDLSATYVNPAGLAFFRTGDMVFTPQYMFGKHRSEYLKGKEMENSNRFTIGTTGFVFGTSNTPNSAIKNSALSISINRTADFNSDIFYRGTNTESSYSEKFLEELQNSGLTDASITTEFPYGTSLAFNTYWLDPVYDASGKVTGFTSKSPVQTGVIQQQTITNRGGVTELALGLAVNVEDKFMVGGSIGVPFYLFNRRAEFLEADATDDETNNFNYGVFREKLRTTGAGFNLKAGVIYKPAESWRLGLALHSPTFYGLTDTYEAELTTDAEASNGEVWSDYSRDYNNGEPFEFQYGLMTPFKVLGSASFVLREIEDVTQQRGFITVDAEYVNHKASSYSVADEEVALESDREYMKSLNRAIDKAYKGAFNFRAGGELKFTTVMVRLGAAYYGNPYKNINGEKGHKINLSGGLGYRNRGFFADLTYVHSVTRDTHFPYRLQYGPYTGAAVKSGLGNVLFTVGFKI